MRNFELEIAEIQKQLNSEDVLPPQAYRRDKLNYSFVSYVNNVTGCYLSSNFKPIPVFIERALSSAEKSGSDCAEYRKLALEYFSLIVAALASNGSITKQDSKNLMGLLNDS